MTDWVPPGYSPTWAEEFDGPSGAPASSATWRQETGGHGWGNRELQYYTDGTANAALDGAGSLAITVRGASATLAAARYGGCRYTSARLISKNLVSFRYGLVTAKIKIPAGRGMWPAFWLLGENFDEVGWPGCGEIDVMENFGTNPAEVSGTVHGPGYSGDGGITGSVSTGGSLADDFHLYSVRWEPDRIRWFVDHRMYHSVTPADLRGHPWVFDHDFFLIINVAVGGTASVPPDDSVSFPQTMLIDYVRVYADAGGDTDADAGEDTDADAGGDTDAGRRRVPSA
ncbi:MAG TPA: glycoside hydrolase family 16 protein [Trebonia sp.]|jgi:beta-glucanase (GH16 family)|nr:glycoside hydrolase family 16 protein [Trebonia sp.]